MIKQGAMTIAEGNPDFKTDVNLVLNNKIKERKNVLRTTLDSLSVWKTKHLVPQSVFNRTISEKTKEASVKACPVTCFRYAL